MTDLYQPADAQTRGLARAILAAAKTACLGVNDPATGAPFVTLVAFALVDGAPALLLSDLAAHTRALAADSRCSLLLAGPPGRGDPMAHPRLTLSAQADRRDKQAGRDAWLQQQPKSRLYYDLADFRLMRLEVTQAFLNAGFGRAVHLTAADLAAG